MSRNFRRIILAISIIVLLVGGIGAFGAVRSRADWLSVRNTAEHIALERKVPIHQPNKPTVAVVLGSPITEIFDFMVPYELFAMTDAYNVYAVAPNHEVTSLTGGLDIIPHYSFAEMDRLLGKSPDLIVVPYMPMVDEMKYQPVRKWLKKHANTEILSICSGAMNLADAGLLNGKSSTIHWRIVDQVKRNYPDTDWVRDRRYIQEGNMMNSAGLTSGIDAVLRVISQHLGEPTAEKIANEINYPSYHFVENAEVEPFYIDWTEAIYYLNLAFQFDKEKIGVLLYDGMEEGALASVFDTYAPLGTTKMFTLTNEDRTIVTKHNLNLIARFHDSNALALDRFFVTGTEAFLLSQNVESQWKSFYAGVPLEFIHSKKSDRFVFDATLEDLARSEDVLTAQWATKRLEYRANNVKFEGKPLPTEALMTLLVLSLIAFIIAFYTDGKVFRKWSK
ncbi:DJ-1/PfpI family protein [Brevibacillus migulae]|uniref:DJ-1/PfpI family protein n=1 Tax=Brevibacillus migulae TaxID=1644114 RepID=UPI00106E48A1|nr:DJ-1/PfpI family protein [Brevibacillus migulae]